MKKYVLNRDLPDHPAGTELETINGGQSWLPAETGKATFVFYGGDHLNRMIETGWVKEVNDCIVLTRDFKTDYRTVEKVGLDQFTEDECKLMEKALNGELVDVDLQEFLRWYYNDDNANIKTPHNELLQAFNNREK